MKCRDVAQKLTRLGCQELPRRSGGSHRKWFNPATDKATVVPDWGAKELKLGTVRAVVCQLGLDWQSLEEA